MIIYMNMTDSLGDFLSGLPTLKGIHDAYGKFQLIIKSTNRKFRGIKELLEYQDLFTSVNFDDEVFVQGAMHMFIPPNKINEFTNSTIRPGEVCRFENAMKDMYGLKFEADDNFVIKFPEMTTNKTDDYIAGDRWAGPQIDGRRAVNVLAGLDGVTFLDYNEDLLTNCVIIKSSNKPFIGNFTGSAVLANLLDKEMWVVWKKEDWAPQFWNGEDILWDNGKNIQQTFERHFYTNRNCKLVHASELKDLL